MLRTRSSQGIAEPSRDSVPRGGRLCDRFGPCDGNHGSVLVRQRLGLVVGGFGCVIRWKCERHSQQQRGEPDEYGKRFGHARTCLLGEDDPQFDSCVSETWARLPQGVPRQRLQLLFGETTSLVDTNERRPSVRRVTYSRAVIARGRTAQTSESLLSGMVGEKVRRERRWTSAGETPARELVRSTR
jgi:hypothetical protein